jgi:flagellar protein FliS
MRDQHANRYLTDKVMTASPAELIGMLYDAGVVAMQAGMAAAEARQPADAHRHLVRAQDIVHELQCSLRLDAGDIAQQLNALYSFIGRRLVEANLDKDPMKVAECLRTFMPLRDAWAEALLGRTPAAVG